MAIKKLPTNYADDIIDISANPHRKYMITDAGATDTFYLEDKTEYIVRGTNFGATDINNTNETINEAIDSIENNEENIRNNDVKISNIINGTTIVGKSLKSSKADMATNAENAEKSNSANNDFILTNQSVLVFVDNVCRISDSRITNNSLADVYFTTSTKAIAEKSVVSVESYDGYIEVIAERTPTADLVATIRVRVI